MKTALVADLFKKATAHDESLQLEFANRLPELLNAFQGSSVEKQLIPFLVAWLQKNNTRILSSVLNSISQLVTSCGSITSVAPIIESLLASDSPTIADELEQILAHVVKEEDLLPLLKTLMTSQYDCVRKFIVRFLSGLSPTEDRRNLVRTLARDDSFEVRVTLCWALVDFDDDLALLAVHTLITDKTTRVKVTLARTCNQRSWFVASIARALVADPDWAVRAAIATHLGGISDAEKACAVARRLMKDSVIQVRLCALRSLGQLLQTCELKKGVDEVRETMLEVMRMPFLTLKKAAIDCFVAMGAKPQENKEFVEAVLADNGSGVRLHFLLAIVRARAQEVVSVFGNELLEVLESLTEAEDWRERARTVELLALFAELMDRKESVSGICVRMLDDGARPVITSAAKALVRMTPHALVNGALPGYLVELCRSDSYTKRQTAIKILSLLYQKANETEKPVLVAEIRRFLSDPCQNVTVFAQDMLNVLLQ